MVGHAQESEQRGKYYLLADLDDITIYLDTKEFRSNYTSPAQKPDIFEFDVIIRIISWNAVMDGYSNHMIRTNFNDIREMKVVSGKMWSAFSGEIEHEPDKEWRVLEKGSLYDVISARLLLYNIKNMLANNTQIK